MKKLFVILSLAIATLAVSCSEDKTTDELPTIGGNGSTDSTVDGDQPMKYITVGIDNGEGKVFSFGLISIAQGNEEWVGSGGRKLDRDTAFGGRPAQRLTSDQLFFGTGNGLLRGVDRVVDGFAPPLIFIEET